MNISLQVQIQINYTDKIDFEEMTDFQMISSHRYPQETDGTELWNESRNNKIVDNEYYNATIEIFNRGLDLISLNLTLVVTFNTIIIQRKATIDYWQKDVSFKLSFNFIPIPYDMDWGVSFATFF